MENTNTTTEKQKKIKLNFKDSKYATGRRKRSIAKVWVKKGSGNIYVTDPGNSLIRKIDRDGFVSTIAGQNGELKNPQGITIDNLDNIYIADTGNNLIRKLKIFI